MSNENLLPQDLQYITLVTGYEPSEYIIKANIDKVLEISNQYLNSKNGYVFPSIGGKDAIIIRWSKYSTFPKKTIVDGKVVREEEKTGYVSYGQPLIVSNALLDVETDTVLGLLNNERFLVLLKNKYKDIIESTENKRLIFNRLYPINELFTNGLGHVQHNDWVMFIIDKKLYAYINSEVGTYLVYDNDKFTETDISLITLNLKF